MTDSVPGGQNAPYMRPGPVPALGAAQLLQLPERQTERRQPEREDIGKDPAGDVKNNRHGTPKGDIPFGVFL